MKGWGFWAEGGGGLGRQTYLLGYLGRLASLGTTTRAVGFLQFFEKKNRITLSLLLLFSKHIKVEAWCAKRKQQSGVCDEDDYEYVQLQVPFRVVCLFFWL